MIANSATIPTQKSIAKSIGVSRETVSQILRGREAHRYNGETRKMVVDAAKVLGYRPHRAAQAMRKGRSNLIGVIHFGTSSHIARQIAHFLPQSINRLGYETLVVDLSWLGNSHHRALEYLADVRVEGVIISHMVESFGIEEVEILTRMGIPAVTLAGNEKLGIPALYADSRSAFRDLVRHVGSLGHRRLLFLTNDYKSRPALSRILGFEDGLREFSDAPLEGKIVCLPADHEEFDPSAAAYQFMRKLIQKNNIPDAVVCMNDHWARGVFAAAWEAGMVVPRDLAVTGFDNEPFAAQPPYYLTTATPDVGEECGKAVEVLTNLITNRPLAQREFIFPCKLMIRKSCGTVLDAHAVAPLHPIPEFAESS